MPLAPTTQPAQHRGWKPLASLCVVLLLALGVRGAVWQLHPELLLEDRDAYAEIARNLAAGRGFSMGQPPHPTAYRPPLYPACVAAVFALGGNETAIGVWQLALGLATVALTFWIGCRLLSWPLAILASGLVAVDPILAQHGVLLMTETLTAFLVTLWIAIEVEVDAAKRGSAGRRLVILRLLSGLVLGLCCLCRPTFLLLAAGWLSWLTLTTVRRAKPGQTARLWALSAFGIGLLGVLAPWTVRNAVVVGVATPATTHDGYTLLLANNPTFFTKVVRQPWGTTWQGPSLRAWQAELEREMAEAHPSVVDEPSRNRWMKSKVWQYIRDEPGPFLWSCGWRILRFWDVTPRGDNYGGLPGWAMFGVGVFYVFCECGAFWGLFGCCKDWRRWAPALSCLTCLLAAHSIYWSDMRMRAPVIPVIAMLASAGWAKLVRRWLRGLPNGVAQVLD